MSPINERDMVDTTNQAKSQMEVQDEHMLARAEQKARLAKVLSRGIVNSRLAVDLPDDVHGEWFGNDASDIARAQALGFTIDDKYATKNALHSDGSGRPIVGDVIFMTCSRETKDIIDEIKREQYEEMHGVGGKGKTKEEREYTTQTQAETPEVPVIDESRTVRATKEDIAAALQR